MELSSRYARRFRKLVLSLINTQTGRLKCTHTAQAGLYGCRTVQSKPSATTNRKSIRPKAAARDIFDCGDSTFWRLAARADFPKARKLSARLVVYDVDELLAWRDAHSEVQQ